MVNIFPYFTCATNLSNILIDHVMFNSSKAILQDGIFSYYNHFDFMVDTYSTALEKIDYDDVKILIGGTGWPTHGNPPFTGIQNAQTYNNRVYDHVRRNGTPGRPIFLMNIFFYEMFNEDMKPSREEQSFGFFYENTTPVYSFWWFFLFNFWIVVSVGD